MCVCSAAAVAFTYLWHITFFGACMALSGYAEKNNRHALTCRKVVPKSESGKFALSLCYVMLCTLSFDYKVFGYMVCSAIWSISKAGPERNGLSYNKIFRIYGHLWSRFRIYGQFLWGNSSLIGCKTDGINAHIILASK